ncbi:MAG: alpha/beta fold hydrolase [Carboxylicivirga sp.]|jgi:alpha-beta hydrolase superfamily lysophospholipase|nr:alpha/beta fold hydrolase [Carboxylicivirga sp.]
MSKRKGKILTLTLLPLLIGFIGLDYFGPRMIIQVEGGIFTMLKPNKHQPIPTPSDYNLDSEKLQIKTKDELSLSGYIIKSNTSVQKGTVILLHGIRSNKEHFLPLARQLADSSYNAVIFDLRGHGESEGQFCTYGYLEKSDVANLVEIIKNKTDLSNNIGIWGQSLGGAIALQSMATIPSIKYGIIESTFSDFDSIVHDYFRYHLGYDIPFLTDYCIDRTRTVTQFEPRDVKPYKYAEKITQPIIIAHGRLDKRISIDYGLKNYQHIQSKNKAFIEIPDANHLNLWKVGGKPYFRTVFEFLNRQTEDHGQMLSLKFKNEKQRIIQ